MCLKLYLQITFFAVFLILLSACISLPAVHDDKPKEKENTHEQDIKQKETEFPIPVENEVERKKQQPEVSFVDIKNPPLHALKKQEKNLPHPEINKKKKNLPAIIREMENPKKNTSVTDAPIPKGAFQLDLPEMPKPVEQVEQTEPESTPAEKTTEKETAQVEEQKSDLSGQNPENDNKGTAERSAEASSRQSQQQMQGQSPEKQQEQTNLNRQFPTRQQLSDGRQVPAEQEKSQPEKNEDTVQKITRDENLRPSENNLKKESERVVYAKEDDIIRVGLAGSSWIFAGIEPEKGLVFSEKQQKANGIVYIFEAEKRGSYTVSFQRQNLTKGEIENSLVTVKVVTENEYEKQMALVENAGKENGGNLSDTSASENSDNSGRSGSYKRAERLYNYGKFQQSLDEYINQYQEGDSKIAERIAQLAMRLEKHDTAISYWKRAVDSKENNSVKALEGLILSAIAADNAEIFRTYLGSLIESADKLASPAVLMAASNYLKDNGHTERAVDVLNRVLQYFPSSDRIDEVYFHLGRLYESDSPVRNIKESLKYYTKVVEEYPVSIHYKQAKKRMEYLENHFFYIR